jgi:DNA-binding response OmpR family regulator
MTRGRILVVDDDRVALSALAEILREEGFLVDTAADGRRACLKLQDFTPDVLLTEVELLDLDGITLGALASQQPRPPAVIFMTTRQDWHTSSSPTLLKPIDIPLLLAAIARALEHRTSIVGRSAIG